MAITCVDDVLNVTLVAGVAIAKMTFTRIARAFNYTAWMIGGWHAISGDGSEGAIRRIYAHTVVGRAVEPQINLISTRERHDHVAIVQGHPMAAKFWRHAHRGGRSICAILASATLERGDQGAEACIAPIFTLRFGTIASKVTEAATMQVLAIAICHYVLLRCAEKGEKKNLQRIEHLTMK